MAPLERFFKLPRHKRQKLLKVARAEFVTHGFERASYNRIIADARVSKGAMYYYFADKADLFSAVVEEQLESLAERVGPLRDACDADDFWLALREWAGALTAVAMELPELVSLGRTLYSEGGAQPSVTHIRVRAHELVVWLLERGRSLGAVRGDVPAEMLAVALTHMLIGLDQWFTEQALALPSAELQQLSNKALELCRDLASPKTLPTATLR